MGDITHLVLSGKLGSPSDSKSCQTTYTTVEPLNKMNYQEVTDMSLKTVKNSNGRSHITNSNIQMVATAGYRLAQQRLLDHHGVEAESVYLDIDAIDGKAHVLVAGEGPPVVMVIGGGGPAAAWIPLMPHLEGFTLYAVDRPGFGLTDTTWHTTGNLRRMAVDFLRQVLDGLEIDRPAFMANSMGGLWTFWLALDEPQRISSMVQIGCPALILGTSAPMPMRLLSIPPLGRLIMKLQPPSAKQVESVFTMMHEDLSGLPELRKLIVECEKLPDYGPTWIELLHAAIRLRGARPEVALGKQQLARVAQPVMMIWGDDDPFGSTDVGKQAAATIPDAKLKVIPGGHMPWLSRSGQEQIGRISRHFLQTQIKEARHTQST